MYCTSLSLLFERERETERERDRETSGDSQRLIEGSCKRGHQERLPSPSAGIGCRGAARLLIGSCWRIIVGHWFLLSKELCCVYYTFECLHKDKHR